MSSLHISSARLIVFRRRLVRSIGSCIVVAGLVLIAGLSVSDSAHADDDYMSASSALAAPLEKMVVTGASSRAISLPAVPASATTVRLQLTAAGAWRDTQVAAAIGPNGVRKNVLIAKPVGTQTGTVDLPLPAGNNGQVTIWSSSASVRIATTATYISTVSTSVPTSTAVPGPTNTGIPSGRALTVHSGDVVITTAGAVIDGWDVRGRITVRAPNVTIKNSIIRGPAGGFSSPSFLVSSYDNARVTITDTELSPSVPNSFGNGIVGNNYSLNRVNIHGVVDSSNILGDNVSITNSWLHDNLFYAHDPNWNGQPSHPDSVQVQNGSNINIDRNSMTGAMNAVVMVTQDRGDVSNLRFTNNVADGGGCSINIADKGYGPVNGIVIINNKFGRNTKNLDCAIIAQPETTRLIQQAGNSYTPDGKPVSIHRG